MPKAPLHLLGQSIDSQDVRDWLALQGGDYELFERGDPILASLGQGDFLSVTSQGLQLLLNPEERITTIFIYILARNGVAAFSGTLLNQLTDVATRADYRSVLGAPHTIGISRDLSNSADLESDQWDLDGIRLRADFYSDQDTPRQVTITLRNGTPNKVEKRET
jgi:hypothetical protein